MECTFLYDIIIKMLFNFLYTFLKLGIIVSV